VDFFRQVLSGIAQSWKQLSASARVNIVVAALGTVAVVVSMVIWGSRPEYARLYDGLDPSETADIVQICEQEDVPYRLEDGERTILVPRKYLSRMRIATSSEGLPKSQGHAPGFELFNDQDIITSRYLQDINYTRAVQGELQGMLNEFEFVNKSLVWISEAKEELFTSDQKPSEASVTLDINRDLTTAEIKAVLHIIASFGGANLDVDHITLATIDGKLLHEPKDSDFDSIASSKLDLLNDYERRAEASAQEALDRAGVKSVVKVSARMDFDSVKEVSTKSEDGAVISSLSNTSTTSNTEVLPGGAPGVMDNLPEGVANDGPSTRLTESTEYSLENFQPSQTTTEKIRSGGTVKQYVVTAFVSGKMNTIQDANGQETSEYVPLTEEEKSKYERMLVAAVGGDEPADVTVEDFPLTVADTGGGDAGPKDTETGGGWSSDWENQVGIGVQLGVILLGLLIVRRLLKRAILTPARKVETNVAAFERPTASAEDVRREEVSAEVARMSQDNPEAVVALLRSWMNEEE